MTIKDLLEKYRTNYEVIAEINLDHWHDLMPNEKVFWLKNQIKKIYCSAYQDNQRILFTLTKGEEYANDRGVILPTLQKLLNEIDISNFFVALLCNDTGDRDAMIKSLEVMNRDLVPITVEWFNDTQMENKPKTTRDKSLQYDYNSSVPIDADLENLDEKEWALLTESKVFCMYPWIHLHAYPTGEAWPCCMAEPKGGSLGSVRTHTMKEIWNSDRMKSLRKNMLSETPDPLCVKCYETEESGFLSGRRSANKHHGHRIHKIKNTADDGTVDEFQLVYWDIRFSNLCNLKCRSCGHIFSSQWYQDQVKLAGPEWGKNNKVLNFAGRTETDMWEQLEPHLDYVEQIYFAGGEPLIMDEHYRILEELERRGKFDVRLIYNTNFTEVRLKNRLVFDYWKKFKSVAVGASLDGMEGHAEYIRKGTKWGDVIENRQKMLEICPEVDFYISPTLSIMNAWHIPDFHKNWVERGFIRHQDLNVNILQDPPWYRVDIAPMQYKQRLRMKLEEHLEWLKPHDKLRRAITGFESAINYMMATDNSHLIPKFWEKTNQLDKIRKEKLLDNIPELEALNENSTR